MNSRDVEHIPEKPEVTALIAAAADPSVAIIDHALASANQSKLCAAAIDMFVSILANEASNLAPKVLATGGVYLAGGAVVHTLAALQRPSFMQAFTRKGRFAELIGRIPVHVVVSQAALAGAAARGLDNSQDAKRSL